MRARPSVGEQRGDRRDVQRRRSSARRHLRLFHGSSVRRERFGSTRSVPGHGGGMARPSQVLDRDVRRHVPGAARRHDRQRRAALHRHRSAGRRRRVAVGGRRVRAWRSPACCSPAARSATGSATGGCCVVGFAAVRRWPRWPVRARPSIGVLIAARVVQGVGRGASAAEHDGGDRRRLPRARPAQARALGTWAAVSSLALPGRATAGRRSCRHIELATCLLDQRPARRRRHCRVAARRAAAARSAAAARFDGLGLAGLVVGLGGVRVHRDRGGPRRGAGVIVAGALVSRRRLRRSDCCRAARRRPGAAAGVCCARRAFLSPERRRAHDEPGLQRPAVRRHPVPAGRARASRALVAGLLVLPLAVPLVALAPVSGRLTAARGPQHRGRRRLRHRADRPARSCSA